MSEREKNIFQHILFYKKGELHLIISLISSEIPLYIPFQIFLNMQSRTYKKYLLDILYMQNG